MLVYNNDVFIYIEWNIIEQYTINQICTFCRSSIWECHVQDMMNYCKKLLHLPLCRKKKFKTRSAVIYKWNNFWSKKIAGTWFQSFHNILIQLSPCILTLMLIVSLRILMFFLHLRISLLWSEITLG